MKATLPQLNTIVEPGNNHMWQVDFVAPEKPGRYTSYFRMMTGENKRFGHKVWCDIQVIEPEKQDVPKLNLEQIEEANVKMVKQEDPVVFAQKEEDVSAFDKALSVSTMKTPKQVYFEKIEELPSKLMKDAMGVLYEIGYVNFALNKSLMEKHGDVNAVVEVLMSGDLGASQFQHLGGHEE